MYRIFIELSLVNDKKPTGKFIICATGVPKPVSLNPDFSYVFLGRRNSYKKARELAKEHINQHQLNLFTGE